MPAPTSAAAVANAFLDLQDADPGRFPPIDQMKIQKLVFYAHAWWLANKGAPLFDEEVYAWPWGPVVPSIYSQFRGFGRDPIVGKRATEMVHINNGPLSYRRREPEIPNPEVMSFLRSVWDTHKSLTGIQLSNATHAPGEPWTIVHEQFGDLEAKPQIPNDLIRDAFRAKIAPEAQ